MPERRGVAKRARRARTRDGSEYFKPIVKLFTPDAQCTWLLTELDDGLAFGLCDLGVGCPELGYVALAGLAAVRGKLRLPSTAIATPSPARPAPPTPTKRVPAVTF